MKKLSTFEHPLCIYCGQQSKVKELLIAYHDEPHKYWECKRCSLIFEAGFEKGFDISKPVENLVEKDFKKFRRQFVEKIDISDEKYNLYPRFQYKDTNEMQDDIFLGVKDRIDRYMLKKGHLKILEVGCATGFLLEKLKSSYSNVDEIGVDPSPISIRKAKSLGLHVVCGTLDTVKFRKNQRFDVIICIGNLMLHPDPLASLMEMKNLMSKDGILIFDLKNVNSLVRRLARFVYGIPILGRTNISKFLIRRSYSNMRFGFSKKLLSYVLRDIGLEILDMKTKPPRLLNYGNMFRDSKGLKGFLWRLFNSMDGLVDERAWIEVCCNIRHDSESP